MFGRGQEQVQRAFLLVGRFIRGSRHGPGDCLVAGRTAVKAAHFAVCYDALAKAFFERKQRKTNGMVAIRAVAHKLARASYCMLRVQTTYDAKRLFA